MREHKHYPIKGGAIYRTVVFFYAVIFHRIIDWNTETANCRDCGKLLRIPKAAGIAPGFFPFVWIPCWTCFAKLLLNRSKLSEPLIILIGVAFFIISLVIIHALLVSLPMAFGKWIVVDQSNQGMEEINIQLRKMLREREKKQKIAVFISCIVCILTIIILWNTVCK